MKVASMWAKGLAAGAALFLFAGPAQALIGDVNGDGKVDVRDARLLANYLVGNSTWIAHPENADVNGDGRITTADALLILQVAKGLRTGFISEPLMVLAASPSSGTAGVLLTAEPRVFFSQPVSSVSLAGGLTLTDAATGLPVPAALRFSGDGVIATFLPSQPLLASRSYRIDTTTSAADNSGDRLRQAFTSSFQTQALGTMTLLSVNNSTAAINTVIAPIAVQLKSAAGAPVAQAPVVFAALTGNGTFEPSGLRQVTVLTDDNGIAQASFRTAGQAMTNAVSVSAVGFGAAAFAVTTMAGPAVNLRVYSGNNQAVAAGQTTTFPLVVQATDAGGNPIAGSTVTFSVTQGRGNIGGYATGQAVTDGSGMASSAFTFRFGFGSTAGPATVSASFPGMLGMAPTFSLTGLAQNFSSDTFISGTVIDAKTLLPLSAVYVYTADSPSISTTTDSIGFFALPVSAGSHMVEADGLQSGMIGGQTYAQVLIPVNAVQGLANYLASPVLLPRLDPQSSLGVSAVEGGTLTIKANPLWQLYVAPGSAHFANGSTSGRLYAAAVSPSQIPMPAAGGKTSRFVDTIEPIDVQFNPPAPVVFPNADGLSPGTVADIFALGSANGAFAKAGQGVVSEDGSVIQSLPGQGITAGGWHLAADPVPCALSCVVAHVKYDPCISGFSISCGGGGSAGTCDQTTGLCGAETCGCIGAGGPGGCAATVAGDTSDACAGPWFNALGYGGSGSGR